MLSSHRLSPSTAAIITVHNYEQFLPSAIESLIAQESPFDEVVVVDDGSTDRSREVAERYEPQVRVVTQEQRGQLAAGLRGAAETTADYVYFLDADDVAEPDLLAVISPLLAERPAKVQFQLRSIDEDGVQTGAVWPTFPDAYDAAAARDDNETLGFYVCPATSGNVFARGLLDGTGTRSPQRGDPLDGTLALLAPYRGEIVSINRPLARYRVHKGSVSQWGRPTPEVIARELALFERQWSDVRDHDARALHIDAAPGTAYVCERQMMQAVLLGRPVAPTVVARYCAAVVASRIRRPQVLILVVWSVLLSLTWGETRRRIMMQRRSPGARGPIVSRVVRTALGRSDA